MMCRSLYVLFLLLCAQHGIVNWMSIIPDLHHAEVGARLSPPISPSVLIPSPPPFIPVSVRYGPLIVHQQLLGPRNWSKA